MTYTTDDPAAADVHAAWSRIVSQHFSMSIGGRKVDASDGTTMQTFDPSTGKVLTTVPLATDADVASAVEAGRRAQPEWYRLGMAGRRPFFERLARLVEEHAEELALIDAVNGGNPLSAMLQDVRSRVSQIRAWPAIAEIEGGKTVPINPDNLHFTEHVPYGVVARIVAYNHPALFAIKAAIPPLAMGNTVVLKPADQTPLSALRIGELFSAVLPPGVFNVVSGSARTGDALVRHPAVKRIGFIGSVATGQRIQASAADVGIKHVSLELGGKNALVAYPDVSIEAVAKAAVRGMNLDVCQGQSCGSTSRVFAHARIHNDLVEAIEAELARVVVGPAYDEGTMMGPLVSRAQHQKVVRYIDGATTSGARLVSGGTSAPPGLPSGYYLSPTLFDRVHQSMAIATEEIFGPVISVLRWDNVEEMISEVNAVEYGLTGSVWTNDLHRALHTARAMNVGYVWVNDVATHYWGMPFGGAKASGLGREDTKEELASYTETKAVNIITRNPV